MLQLYLCYQNGTLICKIIYAEIFNKIYTVSIKKKKGDELDGEWSKKIDGFILQSWVIAAYHLLIIVN